MIHQETVFSELLRRDESFEDNARNGMGACMP